MFNNVWKSEYLEYTDNTSNIHDTSQIALTLYFVISFLFIVIIATISTILKCMQDRRKLLDWLIMVELGDQMKDLEDGGIDEDESQNIL